MASWKVEVIADDSGKWSSNAVRLPEADQATAYGRNLSRRWFSVTEWRVSESDDPPNYTYVNGDLNRIEKVSS